LAEARLRLFVELVISGFAGWTIGYQVAVLAGLPAYAVLALASVSYTHLTLPTNREV